ncbi:MAG TPA: hypothetical protein PKV50_05940 [Prolixibacteraceae bacterium]|nr:hypothetical protein [Prolixibacteraceae bacterium]
MEELEGIFVDLFLFVDELIKDYGEPVEPDDTELEKLKNIIITSPASNDHHLSKNFYLIERVAGEILFSHNVDKYLGLENDFDLITFHSSIQDGLHGWHYLKEYLTWGKVAYLFFREIKQKDEIHRYSFKIRLPIRLKDGQIYWVLQSSSPLELDKNKNVISHINSYTIGELFAEKDIVLLVGGIFKDGFYCNEFSQLYLENRYAVSPFVLSAPQKSILKYFYKNPDKTLRSCSETLKYPVNTLKKYISDCQRKQGIINKAKTSFPSIPFVHLKDVISYLERTGWFNNA